uniref:CARD domain-containing protein n=1 Tax=Gadus morhua TaxID=8049 RepID=A0A8C5BHS4_GADMO
LRDQELRRIRSEFVKGVSDPVIKGLLDDLYHHKVFSTEEMDSVMAERTKADQARRLIDMVNAKGEGAIQMMIDSMKKRDQHFCIKLGLTSSPAGVGELLP